MEPPAEGGLSGVAALHEPVADDRLRSEAPRAFARATRPISGSLLALAGALACGLATIGALVYVLTMRDSQAAAERHHASLTRALAEFQTVLADATVHRAQVIAARGGLTADDLEQHLAPNGLPRYRHQRAYLIGRDGRVAASWSSDAKAVPAAITAAVTALRREISPLRSARSRSFGERDDRAEPMPVTNDIVVIDRQPMLAALVPMPDQAGGMPTDPPVLVALAPIDATMVGALADASGLPGLRFGIDPFEDGGPLHSQTDRRGRIVGWFSWDEADGALSRHLLWLLPIGGGIAFLGFAALSLLQIRRAAGGLGQIEVELRRIAQEDSLTGMPNRRRIIALLGRTIGERRAPDGVVFACLDLDSFKEVNEVLGHDVGDKVIAETAERLRSAVSSQAAIGRIDGDEFAVVMPVRSGESALDTARACAHALSKPFRIGDQVIHVSASIGFALAPRDGATPHELIRRADLAVRAAKKGGRGRILAFHHGLEEEINERRFIEQELRQALADGSLSVFYQPIVGGDGLRIVGAEALVRWKHPTRGNIPPSVFVAVAEQTGLMIQLGGFVLRRALADARDWPTLYIAINLSPIQVRDRGLVRTVAGALHESGIDPARVVLEITEGVLIDNPEEAKHRLKELRGLGVKIALDDFGSGYSSLSYLRRLPIDKLKIDKEFVAPLGRSANGGVILQAIVALGRALGLSVLAEGVETEEQRLLLRLAGCDELQGFLFARPMPAPDFVAFAASGVAVPLPIGEPSEPAGSLAGPAEAEEAAKDEPARKSSGAAGQGALADR